MLLKFDEAWGGIWRVAPPNSLRWLHNGYDSVSNHQPRECLPRRLIRRTSRKTSKLRVTGLCAGNSPETGEFPAQMASNAEMFPFDDVIMLCSIRLAICLKCAKIAPTIRSQAPAGDQWSTIKSWLCLESTIMKVTIKCKIDPFSDLSGNMWKPQKCDGQMDGRSDGWVGLFLLWWGINYYSSHWYWLIYDVWSSIMFYRVS